MHDEVSETENIRKNLAIERMIIEGCEILLDTSQTFVRQGQCQHPSLCQREPHGPGLCALWNLKYNSVWSLHCSARAVLVLPGSSGTGTVTATAQERQQEHPSPWACQIALGHRVGRDLAGARDGMGTQGGQDLDGDTGWAGPGWCQPRDVAQGGQDLDVPPFAGAITRLLASPPSRSCPRADGAVPAGSLIQVPMSEKGKITRGRLGSLSLRKEGERQCFLFSKHLIICTRGSGGKLHLTKVRNTLRRETATLDKRIYPDPQQKCWQPVLEEPGITARAAAALPGCPWAPVFIWGSLAVN